ncbi:MAG: NAD/FAD-binding protein [Alcaligenaceae bacterium]|nr:MAG: NAD/FAD-binding protein [Alcaligenaceae bacterium]
MTLQANSFATKPAAASRIAVIGSGIAGLSTAWLLAEQYPVTLFEAGDYFGGHSNTVDVTLEGVTHPVDTGFLVHNDLTYPNLVPLLAHLGVPVHASDMSFGVSIHEPDIEWAGTNLRSVFAQPSNLFRPKFLGMLRDILRFNREAERYLLEVRQTPMTLGALLTREKFGRPMQEWYLLPMAAAIWSAPVSAVLEFSAATFLSFCLNHRLLQIEKRPQWKTILGGSRLYVQAMLKRLTDARLACPVTQVRRTAESVVVSSPRGDEIFDAVVMACHAPTTLALLEPTLNEQRVLSSFHYQTNEAILHTDVALLPRRQKVWSAWNYMAAGGQGAERPVAVSYLINQLQPLPFQTPVIVTLNPHQPPKPAKVLARFSYEHPVLDQAAILAQSELPALQGQQRTWFCGAWTGFGFHEDGLKSALRVARAFGVEPSWKATYE